MVPLPALVRLTRVWNLLIIGLTQYCTAGLLIDARTVTDPRLLVLAISTMFIAAGGYSINDYYDIKIDLINKPDRVVVGKVLSRRTVLALHTFFSLTGVLLGSLVWWPIGAVNFASAFLLWWYSNALKRLPFIGNFAVAVLSGLAVIVVNVLYTPFLVTVLIYALFAFFMTIIREIIKDMEDLKGDNTFGCRTLPIVWGIRPTKIFIYFLITLFAVVVVVIHTSITPLPVTFFAGLLVLPMGVLLAWLVRADTRRDFYRLSVFCKLIMLAGIFSMAFI